MARPASRALREQIATLEEQAALAERLEGAEQEHARLQAEVGAAQQELASLKAAVLAEGGRLNDLAQQQADARRVLAELGAEREAIQREIQGFARLADEQTKHFRLALQGLVSEPEMTEEEAHVA